MATEITPKLYHVYLEKAYEDSGSSDVYVKAFSRGHAVLPFTIDGWMSIAEIACLPRGMRINFIDMTDRVTAEKYEEAALQRSIENRRKFVQASIDAESGHGVPPDVAVEENARVVGEPVFVEDGPRVYEVTLQATGAKASETVYVRAMNREKAVAPFNNDWLSCRYAPPGCEDKVTVDVTGPAVSTLTAAAQPATPVATPTPAAPGVAPMTANEAVWLAAARMALADRVSGFRSLVEWLVQFQRTVNTEMKFDELRALTQDIIANTLVILALRKKDEMLALKQVLVSGSTGLTDTKINDIIKGWTEEAVAPAKLPDEIVGIFMTQLQALNRGTLEGWEFSTEEKSV